MFRQSADANGAGQVVLLTGRLALPGGLPPDELVPVALDCPGETSPDGATEGRETMTDVRGEFRFRLQLCRGVTADVETMNRYSACAIVVRLPGFEILRWNLQRIDLRSGADVGQLLLKPLGRPPQDAVRISSWNVPARARRALTEGWRELAAGHVESARKHFEKAVAQCPSYAEAWLDLGRLLARIGATDRAAASFRSAVAADPALVGAHFQLALLAVAASRWQEAESESGAVIQAGAGDLAGLHLVHAVACFNLKKLDAAERSARAGLAQDASGRFPKLAHLLGAILEQKSDRAGAAEMYQLYLDRAPQAHDAAQVRSRLEALRR